MTMRTTDQTEVFLMPNGQPYPPHMQTILAKCKAHDTKQTQIKLKFTSTITDVTPEGYGPK